MSLIDLRGCQKQLLLVENSSGHGVPNRKETGGMRELFSQGSGWLQIDGLPGFKTLVRGQHNSQTVDGIVQMRYQIQVFLNGF